MKSKLGVFFTNTDAYMALLNQDSSYTLSSVVPMSLKATNFFESFTGSEEKQITETSALFKKTLEFYKLTEFDTYIVIPDDLCSLQVLRLPIVSEKEVISVIEFQAEEFIPYPLKNTSIDYQVLGVDEKAQKMSVLVVASLKGVIDKISNVILESGLYPISIEPESTVLYRLLFDGYCQSTPELTLMLNIGEKNTQSSLLDIKNKQLVMTHNFNLGINFFIKALQYNLNLSAGDSLAKFAALTPTDEIYIKVIKPLFIEYSKEIEKIVQASQEKLGMAPQSITIHAHALTSRFVTFMEEAQAIAIKMVPLAFIHEKTNPKIKFPDTIDDKQLSLFIPAIGAAL